MSSSDGQWGLCYWATWTETIGKIVLDRVPSPGHSREQNKTALSLPVIKAYLLVPELQPEIQISGLPHF